MLPRGRCGLRRSGGGRAGFEWHVEPEDAAGGELDAFAVGDVVSGAHVEDDQSVGDIEVEGGASDELVVDPDLGAVGPGGDDDARGPVGEFLGEGAVDVVDALDASSGLSPGGVLGAVGDGAFEPLAGFAKLSGVLPGECGVEGEGSAGDVVEGAGEGVGGVEVLAAGELELGDLEESLGLGAGRGVAGRALGAGGGGQEEEQRGDAEQASEGLSAGRGRGSRCSPRPRLRSVRGRCCRRTDRAARLRFGSPGVVSGVQGRHGPRHRPRRGEGRG